MDGVNVRKLRRLAAKVRPEYAPCVTEDCQDGERTDRVKWVLDNRLLKQDRDLMLLYADRASIREVARELGCTHSMAQRHIARIRRLIRDELERINDNI